MLIYEWVSTFGEARIDYVVAAFILWLVYMGIVTR